MQYNFPVVAKHHDGHGQSQQMLLSRLQLQTNRSNKFIDLFIGTSIDFNGPKTVGIGRN